MSAITIWNGAIRASAIWFRATWHRATPRMFAMKDAAWARPGSASISISRDSIRRLGRKTIEERYGNLFDMYQRITDEDPYKVPMRIFPAIHYTMGGLWVDYHLMSTIPGLVCDRRSELLRPRREPAGRERVDAGFERRLLRDSLHGRRLSGD